MWHAEPLASARRSWSWVALCRLCAIIPERKSVSGFIFNRSNVPRYRVLYYSVMLHGTVGCSKKISGRPDLVASRCHLARRWRGVPACLHAHTIVAYHVVQVPVPANFAGSPESHLQ